MLIIVLRLSKTFRSSWSLYEVINCFSCLERDIFYLPDSKLFWVYSNTVDALRKYIGIIASVSILVFHFCNQWWCKTINNMVKTGTLAKVQETLYVAITFNWLVYFKIGHRPKNSQSTKFINWDTLRYLILFVQFKIHGKYHGWVILLEKLQNSSPWVFSRFELYKQYQIAQSITSNSELTEQKMKTFQAWRYFSGPLNKRAIIFEKWVTLVKFNGGKIFFSSVVVNQNNNLRHIFPEIILWWTKSYIPLNFPDTLLMRASLY